MKKTFLILTALFGLLVPTRAQQQLPEPEICVVTVNHGHCNIIWRPYEGDALDHFNIYCERSVTGQYELVGSARPAEESSFTDTLTDPTIRAYRYRITAVDTLGHESARSAVHKTAHLSISQGQFGWNLQWTKYEGIDFSKAYIYRGVDYDSLQLIDSIPGNQFSYTDPCGGEHYYYVVEFLSRESCFETKAGYTAFRSNVASSKGDVGIPEADLWEPQPAADPHYYDLLGRRVAQPQPGRVYIHQGKKIIIQ